MFMCCCIGAFDSTVGRKEAKYIIWELICELCSCYELYKGNIKFYEVIIMYYVQ